MAIRTIESFVKKDKKFVGYYETSAKEKPEEIGQLFQDAIRVGLGRDPTSDYFHKDETDGGGNKFLSLFTSCLEWWRRRFESNQLFQILIKIK